MNPLADFRFQIYTKLSYLTNNSHESFFVQTFLTVVTSVYANNKSNHINLLFCFALNECKQIEYELQVPRSGTYIMKPTASCEAAPLWVRVSPPPNYIVPRMGTDASPMMLRMIVGPALRNQVRVGRIVYPTAALLRSLQWVSDEYVSPRDTALTDGMLWEAAGLRRDAMPTSLSSSPHSLYTPRGALQD